MTAWTHHDPAVRKLIQQAQAAAWEVGYLRGVRDNESDLDRADNPFEETR